MSKKTEIFFYLTLLVNLAIVAVGFVLGFYLISVMMLFATITIFTICFIWFNQRQELKFSFKSKYMALPILLVFGALAYESKLDFSHTMSRGEMLMEVGQLIISRYQAALWAIGLLFVSVFLVTTLVINKGKTE